MFIFISYNKKDRQLVDGLVSELSGFGHTVWFDQEIPAGHAWWDVILETIRKCDLLVFALTPRALESGPCKLEYTYAKSVNKGILPILLADVNTATLPPLLSEIQYVDYRRQQDKEAYKALSKALQTLPPPLPLPDPLPTAPEAPISELGKLGDQVDAKSLSLQEQATLVLELKDFLKQTETAQDARELLLRLRKRPDLFARVGNEIDEALASRSSARPAPSTAPAMDDLFTFDSNFTPASSALPQPTKPVAAPVKGGVNNSALIVGLVAGFFGIFGVAHLMAGKNSDAIKFFLAGIVYDVIFYAVYQFIQSMFMSCGYYSCSTDLPTVPALIILVIHVGIVWVVSRRGAMTTAAA